MSAQTATSGKLVRILYVEDDEDIQKIARVALERIGRFELEIASDGNSGIEKAESFQPQLILLDVMMPDMDGPTTLANLRAKPATSSIPVVFLTARTEAEEQQRYLALGAAGIISKPFDPMTLPEQVRQIWASIDSKPQPEVNT